MNTGGDCMDTSMICQNSRTLKELVMNFGYFQKSILGYKLYVNDASVPIVLNTELDYEPYLAYQPFYIIEDATFDSIRYTKAIRVISPKIT